MFRRKKKTEEKPLPPKPVIHPEAEAFKRVMAFIKDQDFSLDFIDTGQFYHGERITIYVIHRGNKTLRIYPRSIELIVKDSSGKKEYPVKLTSKEYGRVYKHMDEAQIVKDMLAREKFRELEIKRANEALDLLKIDPIYEELNG